MTVGKKRSRRPSITKLADIESKSTEIEGKQEEIEELEEQTEGETDPIEVLYGYWENTMRYIEKKGHAQGGFIIPILLWKRIKRILGKGGWRNLSVDDAELIRKMMEGIT